MSHHHSTIKPPTTISSTATGHKFKISQHVASDTSTKRGPYAIERSLDPKEFVIKRRFGEGAKPLFDRSDIKANQSTASNYRDEFGATSSKAVKHRQCDTDRRSSSSTSSTSSPERYRPRRRSRSRNETSRKRSTERSRKSPSGSRRAPPSPQSAPAIKAKNGNSNGSRKRSPPKKIPYFRDEIREADRLERLYGKRKSSGRSPISQRHRRSPSYSPPRPRQRSRSPVAERYGRRRRSPMPPRNRDRERSRDRDRRHSNSDGYERRNQNRIPVSEQQQQQPVTALATPAAPQIIHVPVPVPAEYAYGYPAWPPPGAWGAPLGHTPHPRYPPAFALPPPYAMPAAMMPRLPLPPGYIRQPYGGGGRMYRPYMPHRFPANGKRSNHHQTPSRQGPPT